MGKTGLVNGWGIATLALVAIIGIGWGIGYVNFGFPIVEECDPIIVDNEIEIITEITKTDNITLQSTIPDSLEIYETKIDESSISDTQSGLNESSILSYNVYENATADIDISISNIESTTITNNINQDPGLDSVSGDANYVALDVSYLASSFEVDSDCYLTNISLLGNTNLGTGQLTISIYNATTWEWSPGYFRYIPDSLYESVDTINFDQGTLVQVALSESPELFLDNSETLDNVWFVHLVTDGYPFYIGKTDSQDISDCYQFPDGGPWSYRDVDYAVNLTTEVRIEIYNQTDVFHNTSSGTWTVFETYTDILHAYSSFIAPDYANLTCLAIFGRSITYSSGLTHNISIYSAIESDGNLIPNLLYENLGEIFPQASSTSARNFTGYPNLYIDNSQTTNNTWFLKFCTTDAQDFRLAYSSSFSNSIDYMWDENNPGLTLKNYDFAKNLTFSIQNISFSLLLDEIEIENYVINDYLIQNNIIELSFYSIDQITFDLTITITLYSAPYLELNTTLALTQLIFQLTPVNDSSLNVANLLPCTNSEIVIFTQDPQILESSILMIGDLGFRLDHEETGLIVNRTYIIEIDEISAVITDITDTAYICTLTMTYSIEVYFEGVYVDTLEYVFTSEWLCYFAYFP